MSVLLMAGSQSERSRTAALLADFGHRAISQVIGQMRRAQVVIVATPVYKAAYWGERPHHTGPAFQ